MLDAVEEITSLLGPSLREKDEAKKLEMRAALVSTSLPQWFSLLEKHLASLGGDSYAVGNSLTIADLKVKKRPLHFLTVFRLLLSYLGSEVEYSTEFLRTLLTVTQDSSRSINWSTTTKK